MHGAKLRQWQCHRKSALSNLVECDGQGGCGGVSGKMRYGRQYGDSQDAGHGRVRLRGFSGSGAASFKRVGGRKEGEEPHADDSSAEGRENGRNDTCSGEEHADFLVECTGHAQGGLGDVSPLFLERLMDLSMFRNVPRTFYAAIAVKMKVLLYHTHECIVKMGEPAEAIYWILYGAADVTSPDGKVTHAVLVQGAHFGEIGLLFKSPRVATVVAKSKILVGMLAADDFNQVLASYPAVERQLRDEAQQRLAMQEKRWKVSKQPLSQYAMGTWSPGGAQPSPDTPFVCPANVTVQLSRYISQNGLEMHSNLEGIDDSISTLQFLKSLPLFARLPVDIIHEFALSVKILQVPAFQYIIRKGEVGRDVYFILTGKFEVLDRCKDSSQSVSLLAQLGPGQYFGEMGFLDALDGNHDENAKSVRSADIRSISASTLLVLAGDTFSYFCSRYPWIKCEIRKIAGERNRNNSHIASRAAQITTGNSFVLPRGPTMGGNRGDLPVLPTFLNESKPCLESIPDSKFDDNPASFCQEDRPFEIVPVVNSVANPRSRSFYLPVNMAAKSSSTVGRRKSKKRVAASSSYFPSSSASSSAVSVAKIRTTAKLGANKLIGNLNCTPPFLKPPLSFHQKYGAVFLPPPTGALSDNIQMTSPLPSFSLISSLSTYCPLPRILPQVLEDQARWLPTAAEHSPFVSASTSTMRSLPEKILLQCFRFLTLPELMKLRIVCRRWRQLLYITPGLFTKLDLTPWNNSIDDKALMQVTDFVGSRPKSVDLSNCYHITDNGFSYMINEIGIGGQLKRVNIKSCWEVSAMAIMDLAVPSIGGSLEEIDLTNCRKVRDEVIQRLIGWEPSTTIFGPPMNDTLLDNLQGTPLIQHDHTDFRTLHPIQNTVPEVSHFTTNCTPTLNQIGCRSLHKLVLRYCKNITDTTLYHISIYAKERLTYLDLTRCTGLTDMGFSYWSSQLFMNLHTLILTECIFLTDVGIRSIVNCAPNLEHLNLSFCCSLTELAVELLWIGCLHLRTLDLSFCGRAVNNVSLLGISMHLRKLQRIILKGCPRITRSGVDSLLGGFAPLAYIDISQCRNAHMYQGGPPATKFNLAPGCKSIHLTMEGSGRCVEVVV
ncbi:AER145Wp [Eremothecium gossypii ATCC 10895]|uniref:AER145Wp n=1 Tax=Eremothecium gossypii (strain ATCC 10895 / CBS 109.51 / FGSC 9923 / NRRL Y-1056) TaxID=284811 RepID=Q756V6_EREGS|nr:AER145Wp [Eremothecium gossypii ATCC 10895]AAS52828.1 AER145Wp [Eremothecium gossypii ATCC 10895]AEY97134.1 FAER145Wp [Eremothecium gossypii FDAG1]